LWLQHAHNRFERFGVRAAGLDAVSRSPKTVVPISRVSDVKPDAKSGPTIGLALGGGGARGIAHILMIEALEELGVRPALITGTSIGAIFGAALASGLSADHIRAHTEETLGQRLDLVRQLFSARAEPLLKIFNVFPVRSALLKPEALLELLLPSRVAKSFEELQVPLEVVATDFYAQKAVVFGSGPLQPAVAASMALPAVFQPVIWNQRALVDGGLVNPLPFDLICGRADVVVAIDVSGAPRQSNAEATAPSAFESLFSASQIMQNTIVHEKLKSSQPDIFIDVDVDNFHVLEFYRHKDILAAAIPAKERLKRQLGRVLETITLETQPPPAALADGTAAASARKHPLKAIGKTLSRRRRKE